MRPELRVVAVVAAVLSFTACPGKLEGPTGGGAGGGDGGGAGGGGGFVEVDAGYTRSAKGNVRFKGDLRTTLDFANALALPADQVCNELGQYPCTFVHVVALQGVDPYGKGLFEPVAVTGSTAPIVVERMALAACVRRVELDLATPAGAVIFKSIPLDGTSGRLSNVSGVEVRNAITELAQRAWLRLPTDAEVAHFVQLNADLEASNVANPGRTWMQLACFTALTSTEFLFY